MSNPTNPFSWQMPTPTDLVTDLPADFEVFGQAVATSLADLLGGTTGQILSKTSNTDMDFTWVSAAPGDITGVTAGTGISGGGTSGDVTVTNSMATAIDAKGDLIVGTGADTFSKLSAGTNGYLLTADSAEATGLKWSAPSAGALTLIAATTTFSSSSAVNVNDVFSATYENYLILLNLDSASVDDYTNFRVRVGGSDETSSIYNWSLMANGAGNSAFDGGAGASQSSYRLSYIAGTGQGASMVINVNRPYLTKATNLNVSSIANFSTSSTLQLKSGGSVGNTTSYTGFTIFPASGNITGKVAVYGYSI